MGRISAVEQSQIEKRIRKYGTHDFLGSPPT
jgi:hypothetical protein